MLLALWFDFWPANYGPWPAGIPPPPVTVNVKQDAGHSKGRDQREFAQVDAWPDRAPDDYWEARAAFLKRHAPVAPAPYIQEIPEVRKIVQTHNRTLEIAARVTLSKSRLINVGRMLEEMETRLTKMEQDAEDEAIEILLLI